MQGDRYDRGWAGRGYGRDYSPRGYDAGMRGGPAPGRGAGSHRYDEGMRRGRSGGGGRGAHGYDTGVRGRHPRAWTPGSAFGREPWMLGMAGPGMFAPFGWDPMLRWTGWDPAAGLIPYQDGPAPGLYGRGVRTGRYDRPYRGGMAHGYGGDYGPRHRVPPRESPLYGRGGDRAVREWARGHGYQVDYTIQPHPGPRR